MSSIKKNYFYNILINFTGIIIPLITFPYITRILGPENIGKVNFTNSIVDYFLVIFLAGIGPYALRELSKVKENALSVNKKFSEFLILNSIFSLIAFGIFLSLVFTIDKFYQEKYLFLIIGLQVLINIFGFDWVFMAYEKYSYISLRVIIARVIGVILVFLFVRDQKDYLIYAFTTLFLSGWISHIINIFLVWKYVKIDFSQINPLVHIFPIITTLSVSFSSRVYGNLDLTFLGFLSDYQSLGYYVVGLKIIAIIQSLIFSLVNATAPRISYYSGMNNQEKIESLVKKSIQFTFFLTIPATFGIIFLSKEIVIILSGIEFLKSIPILILMSVIMLFNNLSMILGLQYLYYTEKEKKYLLSIIPSIVIFSLLSLILIPKYGYIGAGISRGISDLFQLLLLIYQTKEVSIKSIISKENLKYLILGLIMFLVLFVADIIIPIEDIILRSIIFTSIGMGVYIGINLLLRDYFLVESLNLLLSLIRRKK